MTKSVEEIILEVQRTGYCVLDGFLCRNTCHHMRATFDKALDDYADQVKVTLSEGTFGDQRLFGMEEVDSAFADLANHELLLTAARGISGMEAFCTHSVMTNRVSFDYSQTKNSGGGWHRDTNTVNVKALVYLTDVGNDNGPFCVLQKSRDARLQTRGKSKRFADDVVERHAASWLNRTKIVELVGQAGTCVVFDTKTIHRGKNIEAGERYATTLYMFEDSPERWAKTYEAWGDYMPKRAKT